MSPARATSPATPSTPGPEPLGALCLVLHGHLPYVLHHGAWPHGEAWLFEAAAETYLPLLDTIGEVALHKIRPALTIGLTPVLLEQLAHDRFKQGFVAYLAERADRARADRRLFESQNQPDFAALAERWAEWYEARLAHFERIHRDIPAAFAARRREGHVQLLTSTATHAYTPLLLHDASIRAQFACGTQTTEDRLGFRATGMWLPECAYRPSWDHWVPSVLFDDARSRPGLEQFMAEAGVTHFFVDTRLVTEAKPLGTMDGPGGAFRTVIEPQLYWDRKRGWNDPLRPVGVSSATEPPRAFAFARHPKVSEQVWSGFVGYPASGEYLDFHRKHPASHLRYHRVTDPRSDEKQPYDPEATPARLYEQGQHFCDLARDLLREFKQQTGQPGVCDAPFDAE